MLDQPGDPTQRLRAAFTARQPIRTGSLIITVFGDVILPRGGGVLLSDLIGLLEAFSINDNQARTAMSRLVADGWLAGERLGRRSLYRLSRSGRHRFDEAARRIYSGPPQHWRGDWHVVILPPASGKVRGELRKDLGWLGFGVLAPGIMLHPAPDPTSLASVIEDLPAQDRPLVVAGAGAFPMPERALHTLVAQCWNLEALTEAYHHFLTTFSGLHDALHRGFTPKPLPALLARLMLVHDYRRIILRDPMLPPSLLPGDWIGRAAYDLARMIYRALAPPAEHWIGAHLHAEHGPLPPPDDAFRARFP